MTMPMVKVAFTTSEGRLRRPMKYRLWFLESHRWLPFSRPFLVVLFESQLKAYFRH